MNSREKGKRGEREWAKFLRDLGYADARRGVQHAGGPDSPDVVGGIPGTHAEVKRTEALSVYKAMDQAERDAGGSSVPYVAYRRNGRPWLIIIPADRLEEFAKSVVEGSGKPPDPIDL